MRHFFDAFAVDKTATEWSPYPGFWDHDAQKVRTIVQAPNATLLARTEPLPARNLKSAKAVWEKARGMLFVSRLWHALFLNQGQILERLGVEVG